MNVEQLVVGLIWVITGISGTVTSLLACRNVIWLGHFVAQPDSGVMATSNVRRELIRLAEQLILLGFGTLISIHYPPSLNRDGHVVMRA